MTDVREVPGHLLRGQLRVLAKDLGYELHPPDYKPEVVYLLDIFRHGDREVRVGYASNQNKVVHLHVNGERMVPAGKWPTINALKAVGTPEQTEEVGIKS